MMVQQTDPVADAPFFLLPLTRGLFTKVDPERFDKLSRFKWTARKANHKYYAVRKYRKNGKQIFMHMHRHIAETPDGEIPHHQNDDSLDNRRANLLNMSEFDHIKRHSWR